jgi:hypothetical protein
MHILSNLIRRLLAWLNAIDQPVETTPTLLCWSDLPSHHPCE